MKLTSGDPISTFWQRPVWEDALWVLVAGFVTLVVMNWISLATVSHHGRPGISRFRGVILGDSIILPLATFYIAYFYKHAGSVDSGWLTSTWLPWLAVVVSLLVTTIWIGTAMGSLERPDFGDWTTVPGGVNQFGWLHGIFFWSQAYIWLLFDIKGFGYLITQDASDARLWFAIASVTVLIVGHLYLMVWDMISVPRWPWSGSTR